MATKAKLPPKRKRRKKSNAWAKLPRLFQRDYQGQYHDKSPDA